MLQQRSWMPAPCRHIHTPERNSGVESQPKQWWSHRSSRTLVLCSCVAVKPTQLQQLGIPADDQQPLWLDSFYRSCNRMDAQLDVADKTMGGACRPSSSTSPLLSHTAGSPMVTEYQDGAVPAVMQPCEIRNLRAAVDAVTGLAETPSRVSIELLSRLIKRCGAERNLVLGRRLDDLTVKLGYESNAFLANHILRMYACQGRLEEAMKVFTRVSKPNAFMWSSIISAQVKHGNPRHAIELYHKMRSSGSPPDGHVFVAVLQACAKAEDVESGRQVHAHVLDSGMQPDIFVANCMVGMYAKCGQLEDARRVFDTMVARDAVTWNSMINGYAANGLGSQALDLYAAMEHEGLVVANNVTYACLLKACADTGALQEGRRLHSRIVETRLLEKDTVVGNCLVNMYAKCGKLEDAQHVFDSLAIRDEVTWTAMINGYSDHGLCWEALALYARMQQEGQTVAQSATFACLLKACARAGALEEGKQLHAEVVNRGFLDDIVVSNCLVNMYAKCGKLEDARHVFDILVTKNAVTWTALMTGYAEHGLAQEAFTLYTRMEQEGVILADSVTFACLLNACASAGALQQGRQLHSKIMERRLLQGDNVVGSCLVNMYVKCGELEAARIVFDSLDTKNVVAWTALINGYAEHGHGQEALNLYAKMEHSTPIGADRVTYVCLLKAFATAGALQQGRQLHSQILEQGLLEEDVVMGNCLISMYAKCGQLEDARLVFDNLGTRDAVTWSAMITGYAEHGFSEQALSLYARMELDGLVVADSVTYVCLLKACANAGALQQGRQLHSQIVERGLLEGDTIVGNCLISMYAKCGNLEDARIVFDSLSTTTRDVLTWATMINGYADHGLGTEALTLYASMEQEGQIVANDVMFGCLLKACASAGALQQGRQLHSQIMDRGLLEGGMGLGTSLVHMYAKCGRLDEARSVFDSLVSRDVVAWTAMINGYGTNNHGHKAVACFEEMVQAGVQPESTTFTCLLVACSHEGLVDKGRRYFDAMVKQHGLNPTAEHYVCMVDLLGRAGLVDEAEKMLQAAGCKNNAVGLMSLLNACKSHGDVERGKRCFESLLELDPLNASAYVLMANIYADADRWADADRIERLRKMAGASKKPAVATIEVKKQVHAFSVGEEKGDISCKVRSTNVRLKEEGDHVPHTTLVLKPISEKEKEEELCGHAEKLALAYGLFNTPAGTPLLVTKNLRMCRDCHSSTEIMSRVENRDIVVRDAHRVHRFEAGFCSCKGRC